MFLKIFFGESPLFLCDTVDETIQPYVHHDDAIFIDELNAHTIKTMIHEMKKPQVHAGVFFHRDLAVLKKAFWRKFTNVDAAGGLVNNEKNELLMIFRLGKWDLPKGKRDKGETWEQCAIREVEEETGVTKLKLKKKIGETRHSYDAFGKQFLKTTYWYHMSCPSGQQLQPQTNENITDIRWVQEKDIDEILKNTYASITDILGLYFDGRQKLSVK